MIGSHGRSAVGRFFLGSISQKVLTEADCSVRIAGKVEVDPSPARIVIGYDGSGGANAAVDIVASRCWPNDSEVKLVAVQFGLIARCGGCREHRLDRRKGLAVGIDSRRNFYVARIRPYDSFRY